MIIVKIVGKIYKKEELQENSVKIRKWFALQCMNKQELNQKYYEISDVEKLEQT